MHFPRELPQGQQGLHGGPWEGKGARAQDGNARETLGSATTCSLSLETFQSLSCADSPCSSACVRAPVWGTLLSSHLLEPPWPEEKSFSRSQPVWVWIRSSRNAHPRPMGTQNGTTTLVKSGRFSQS